jgi:uncharacterized protein (TIGR03067 family)
MYRNIWVICVIAISCAISSAGEVAKDELEKMKGDWTLVSTEFEGKKTTPDDYKEFSRSVKGASYTVTVETEGGVQNIGVKIVKLDGSKSPKTIDVELKDGKGKILHGIYKFEGDTQVICLAGPDKDRPSNFDSKEGTVTVWKRVKAPAKEKKD